ncbi:MAG: leucine-rich repeat protein [Clostridia bacterium]|nr:leucine-rich repeat protein [Clostridia bacterium]
MKKLFRKTMLFITLITMLLLASISAEAATEYTSGDWTYTVSSNVATITKYNGSDTNITLPVSLGGYSVKHVGYSSFKDNSSISSVVIPEGIETIGDYAFMNCSYLKTVKIPKSIKQIGTGSYTGNCFENCIRLETVTLTEDGTAEVEIHTAAFANCTALKSITIPANYKNTGNNAFAGCTSLKTVVIKSNSDVAFERIVDYRSFYGCTALQSIEIPEGFITIGDSAFMDCSYLKTVKIPKSIKQIGTGSYTGNCFENCIRLETVTLTEGGTAEVEIHTAAFANCTALKSITIPANYKNTGNNAFAGCTSLKTVVIKDNSDGYFERTIDYRSFYGCTALTTVHIPVNIKSIDSTAFTNCAKTLTLCSKSSECPAKEYAQNNSLTFKVCDGTHNDEKPIIYTLSYNANGGSGAPASQSGATSYTISSTQPTRSGYTFLGWSKSSSATMASYTAGDSITLTANTTLYAVWQKNAVAPTPDEPLPVELLKIKINKTTTTTINYGDTLVLQLEEIEIPEGYAVNWFVEGAGVSTTVSEDGLECRVTSIANGNATIYAKLVDTDENVVTNADGEEIFDEITVTSKAGFWQKFVSFFKNLFGVNRVIY